MIDAMNTAFPPATSLYNGLVVAARQTRTWGQSTHAWWENTGRDTLITTCSAALVLYIAVMAFLGFSTAWFLFKTWLWLQDVGLPTLDKVLTFIFQCQGFDSQQPDAGLQHR